MAKGIIIESVKDALAAGSNILESAEKEVVWILEPAMLALSFQFDIPNKSKMLMEKGGRVRGITKISGSSLDLARRLLDNGEEVRHIDQYQGAFMVVGDQRESISSINVNMENVSLDDPLVAFWTDDQAYADFLIATFEAAWDDAVDAEKRLREL
ncbi:MAG TPA: hypothetical protein VEF35_09775 [Candidatus Bathyarchaeia archaeon]|nr:hypothetical protein [Candidatus Bathyarchaeia archaeon]